MCLLFATSCTDQGCIDADDFGEYESEVIEISANSTQDACNYDPAKDLTDSSQGASLVTCFTTGTPEVYDTSGNVDTSTGNGCTGFTNASSENTCINYCVQDCLLDQDTAASGSTTTWKANSERSNSVNSGVTIIPGSEIQVTVIGDVVLGSDASYNSIYVNSDEFLPHSNNSSGDSSFFDISSGQTINVLFSGKWNNGTNNIGGGNNALSTSANATDSEIYNGARRLAAFLIDHPSGYDFDASATSEEDGSKNVPLLPDPRAWECTYDTAGNITESNCVSNISGGYSNIYANVNDELTASVFGISSTSESDGLGDYGGIIRWVGDGLVADDYDPFSSESCSILTSVTGGVTADCPPANVASFDSSVGRMIGDYSTTTATIENPSNYYSYALSFKSLLTDDSCDQNLYFQILDADGKVLKDYSSGTSNTLSVNNLDWSSTTTHLLLEPFHSLVIETDTTTNTAGNISGNCGAGIAVKFARLHDIQMIKSGFVSFSTLGVSSASSNCTLYGRIINPNGSHTDATFTSTGTLSNPNDGNNYSADFYEYDDFNASSSKDPLNSLTVYSDGSGAINWSNKVFLRKGQKIRLLPKSWDNDFTTSNNLTRQCGIGMAMKIDPRPALLCRGQSSSETVSNPSCTLDYDSDGILIGCQAASSDCFDNTSTSYCYLTSCLDTITCTDGIASNNYAKTCTQTAFSDTTNCPATSYTTSAPIMSADTCTNCSNAMIAAARTPGKVAMNNLDQCYDLENYTGKVANIYAISGFSEVELANAEIAKGAVKLGSFSDTYGNFSNFFDTKDTDDNSDEIFQGKSPIIFSKPGRLRFFMIDGDDFNSATNDPGVTTDIANDSAILAYDDNTSSGSYSFRLDFSGLLSFSNGKWLEARLCQETSSSSVDCLGTVTTKIDDQPYLVDITKPTAATSGAEPDITSPYKFDNYGNLIRTGSIDTGDCTLDNTMTETRVGSYFYCHTKEFDATSDSLADKSEVKRLRLTFKILDPEAPNCLISDPSSTVATTYDGIRLDNSFFDSTVTNNHSKTCGDEGGSLTPGSDTTECQKEYYCGNIYNNNSGKYYVKVKVKTPPGNGISSIIGSVITPIIKIMDGSRPNCDTNCTVGQAERIYKLLIADPRYKAIVTMSLVLMFTFYGLGFLMGVSELNHSEIINRLIKIGLIYLFIGENGWDWFNNIVVKFFKNGTDYLAFLMASSFDSNPAIIDAISNDDYYDKSILFSSVDQVFSMFFSLSVQKKISALLFASIFGWAYCGIILWGFFLYVFAVANAVLLYLTAQVFISILFTLGPIFFIFTLFNQTKEMFDNWLKQLIGFSLQQIFLLTTLAFFNMLMYEIIKMSLGYKICWDEIWTINIIIRVSLMSFWTIASLPPRTNSQSNVGEIGNPDGIPSLFTILFILVIASLMNKFVGFMTDLAASIGGGISASSLGKGITDAAKDMKKTADKGKKAAWNRTAAPVIARLDHKLFDSGKQAHNARDDRKAKDRQDRQLSAGALEAANKNESKIRSSDKDGFSKKDKKEQAAILKEARDEGAKDFLKKEGIDDPKRVEDIMKHKGLTTQSNTIGGAILDVGGQIATYGTRSKSLNDKAGSLEYTQAEVDQAMKGKSKEERKEFAESGIRIKKSRLQRASAIGTNAKSLGKSIGSNFNMSSKKSDAAADQLEKDGAISKGSKIPFTNIRIGEWARSKKEKELKKELVQKNTDASKDTTKKASASSITALKRAENYANTMDDISTDKYQISKAARTTVALAFKNAPSINSKSSKKQVLQKKEFSDEALNEVNDDLQELNIKGENIDKDLGSLKTKRNNILKERGIDPLKKDKTKKEKAEIKKLDETDSELMEVNEDINVTSAASHQNQVAVHNATKRQEKIATTAVKANKAIDALNAPSRMDKLKDFIFTKTTDELKGEGEENDDEK